ncbi:hypothetical protein JGI8_01136 [Candidatus Kryptonium thompsonii]|uniref:Uncharacterized protein n=1 Tax=Candidatus Kryptonium thompsonii TaxID=1633631 RepID=A0ABM9UVH4_9BACT|nr:hypothetical protein [Candidatus Kryptonium thompsoni]CUS87755.1 hypothetical protein JGI8_01136 [Candidatus Kryptonium thompsoni]
MGQKEEVKNNAVIVLVDSAEQYEKAKVNEVVKEKKKQRLVSGFVATDVRDRTYF